MTQGSVPPFRIESHADSVQDSLPLLLSSPHSGRSYPSAFLSRTRLRVDQLRRSEDAWVDALLKPALAATGAALVAANYGRALIDLNRAPDELDPDMFHAGAVPAPPSSARDRILAGLGVLPRVAGPGLDIYAHRLDPQEAQTRIATVHQPYHGEIAHRLTTLRNRFGYAVLIDCHSMPSLTTHGSAPAPVVVLGDRHGRSAHPALSACMADCIAAQDLPLARNHPYAGGFTTAHHAAPSAGIHVLQLEIDRALYMDQQRLAPHGGFDDTAQRLAAILSELAARLPALDLGIPPALAAE